MTATEKVTTRTLTTQTKRRSSKKGDFSFRPLRRRAISVRLLFPISLSFCILGNPCDGWDGKSSLVRDKKYPSFAVCAIPSNHKFLYQFLILQLLPYFPLLFPTISKQYLRKAFPVPFSCSEAKTPSQSFIPATFKNSTSKRRITGTKGFIQNPLSVLEALHFCG